jgi:hypothetical protein
MAWEPGRQSYLAQKPALVPKFVWGDRDLRGAGAAGVRRVTAIGAPFLYLLKLRPRVAPPGRRRLLVFPYHSDPSVTVKTAGDEYARYLAGLAYDEVTVCLHPFDFAIPERRRPFAEQGFSVTKVAAPFDPRFLDRLLDLIESHSAVTANRVSTALFYAAATGRRTFIGGPLPTVQIVGEAAGPIPAQAFHEREVPELLSGVEGERAKRFADSELGGRYVRDPGELRRVLGWGGPRRALSLGLAAAARARRLKVSDGSLLEGSSDDIRAGSQESDGDGHAEYQPRAADGQG